MESNSLPEGNCILLADSQKSRLNKQSGGRETSEEILPLIEHRSKQHCVVVKAG